VPRSSTRNDGNGTELRGRIRRRALPQHTAGDKCHAAAPGMTVHNSTSLRSMPGQESCLNRQQSSQLSLLVSCNSQQARVLLLLDVSQCAQAREKSKALLRLKPQRSMQPWQLGKNPLQEEQGTAAPPALGTAANQAKRRPAKNDRHGCAWWRLGASGWHAGKRHLRAKRRQCKQTFLGATATVRACKISPLSSSFQPSALLSQQRASTMLARRVVNKTHASRCSLTKN
jgi:hypothetical protein